MATLDKSIFGNAMAAPAPQPASAAIVGAQSQQLGTPTQWNVSEDQTVEGRVNRIIQAGSPLQEQAKARSLEAMNARGLGNSSLAITAGESALYDAALPIASADAATFSKAAGYNADQSNQFATKNADAENQFKLTDKQAATQLQLSAADTAREKELALLGRDTQTMLADKDAALRTGLADKEVAMQRELAGVQDARERQLAGQTDARTRELAALEDARNRALAGQEDTRTRFLAQLEDARMRDLAAGNNSNDQQLALINRDTQLQLSQMQANEKALADQIAQQNQRVLETNSQAASAFNTAMSAVNNIQTNSQMDAATKTQAVAQVWSDLQTQLRVLGSVSGLNLTSQLNFANMPGFDAGGQFVGFDGSGNTVGQAPAAPMGRLEEMAGIVQGLAGATPGNPMLTVA